MRNIARFVVDTHSHITTLYQPKGEDSMKLYEEGKWTGLNGYIEHFDNSDFAVYDMDRYGVDMAILLPSMLGCTNQAQLNIMDKHPGRFAACCCDGDTLLKHYFNPSLKYDFQESLDEVEAALKTGRFSGIGEFAPGINTAVYKVAPTPTLDERLEQWSAICDLAIKYNVPVHYHDFLIRFKLEEGEYYNYNDFLEKLVTKNPKAKIVASHGGKDPMPGRRPGEADREIMAQWKDFYAMAAANRNLYLECGGWCEKNFEVAFDCDVKACNIMWGHDYGNVPQYLIREAHLKHLTRDYDCPNGHLDNRMWKNRTIDSLFGGMYKELSAVPTYQSDFYGWSMRIVDRVGDWLTQDEINLMMGGTAARLYKLPVPHSRMFAEARPDIFGQNWKEEWYPFIPDNQVRHPDPFRLPTEC